MKRQSKFFGEFKKFILRGNVMDMAVGVIVGGAFTSIVTSLNFRRHGLFLPYGYAWNRRKCTGSALW